MTRKTGTLILAVVALVVTVAGCPNSGKQGDVKALDTGQATRSATVEPPQQDHSANDPALGWIGDAVDFSCTTFDGQEFRAGTCGKPVLVNFWAAW